MEKVVAVILMAGLSKRFAGPKNKQLCLLNDNPVFSYSIKTFAKAKSIDNLVIVVNKDNKLEIEKFINRNKINAVLVLGGKTRQESVEKGLKALNLSSNDIVIIHDGARPLIEERNINDVIAACKKYDASSVYMPCVNTVAKINKKGEASEFIDRSTIALIQTPQAFKFKALEKAHQNAKGNEATDDCSLVMQNKGKVKLVLGSEKLHKITTRDDIKYLEGLLKL